MSRIKAYALLALLIPLVLLGNGSTLISPDKLLDQSVVNYNLTSVNRGDFIKSGRGGAELYYVHTKALRFKNQNARLGEIIVKKEKPVEKGEIVARFDIEASRAELTRMNIAYRRAQEADIVTQAEWQNRLMLAGEEISSATDIYEREILRLKYDQLSLQYEQYCLTFDFEQTNLKKNIDKLEEGFNDNELVAPFDGIVKNISVKRTGDTVTPYDTIITLYSKDRVLLRVEDISKQIRYNMKVVVESGSRNNTSYYKGTVVAADNVLPEDLRTGYAYIQLDDPDVDPDTLKFTQMTYDVIRLDNVLMLKKNALTMERGSQYASILVDDMVKKRFVNVGPNNADSTVILQGLGEGQDAILR